MDEISYFTYKNLVGGGIDDTIVTKWQHWEKEYNVNYLPKNQKIFEVGSGHGWTIKTLKEYDNTNYIVGSDISPKALSCISEYADESTLFDISKDKALYDNHSFDVVLCFEVLEHLSSPYHAILEIKRLCKWNGLIHISIPDYDQQKGYGPHQHAFVYPGFFKKEYFEIFLMQMYLKVEFYCMYSHHSTYTLVASKNNAREVPLHHYFVCKNLEVQKDIIEVVASDNDAKELYKFVGEK